MPSRPMINRAKRGAFDELYTPAEAIIHLLPYLPGGLIWEPAPGTGQLVQFLQRSGREVVWGKQDYFQWQPEKWDMIITNPPFSKKAAWLKRANELGRPWAILLPVMSLGARNCQRELVGCSVLFLPRRIDFTGKRAPWFAVAWFIRGIDIGWPLQFVTDGA